jgi:hypothetical protein
MRTSSAATSTSSAATQPAVIPSAAEDLLLLRIQPLATCCDFELAIPLAAV